MCRKKDYGKLEPRRTGHQPMVRWKRYNRTLMQVVRCYVGKTQNKWDEYLPQIAGARGIHPTG